MSYSVKIPNGILTMCVTDFNCPKCGHTHTEKDYWNRLDKSTKGFIYKKCNQCQVVIGISTDITGDVVVWLKEKEAK